MRDLEPASFSDFAQVTKPLLADLGADVRTLAGMAYPGEVVTGDVFRERLALVGRDVPEALQVHDWSRPTEISILRVMAYKKAARELLSVLASI